MSDKWSWWEDLFYDLWVKLDEDFEKLNTPDLKLKCPNKCNGRLVAFKRSRRGLHFRCLGCFKEWVKPPRGQLYRETTVVKRLEGYKRLARS